MQSETPVMSREAIQNTQHIKLWGGQQWTIIWACHEHRLTQSGQLKTRREQIIILKWLICPIWVYAHDNPWIPIWSSADVAHPYCFIGFSAYHDYPWYPHWKLELIWHFLTSPLFHPQKYCSLNVLCFVNSRNWCLSNSREISFWNTQTRLSGTNQHIVVKFTGFALFQILMFNVNINRSSWPVYVWFYALCCCHMFVWYILHKWAGMQVFLLKSVVS